MAGRYGAGVAAAAQIAEGFDREAPLAAMMISEALADILAAAARDPETPIARGLEIVVEQRLAA